MAELVFDYYDFDHRFRRDCMGFPAERNEEALGWILVPLCLRRVE